MESNASKLHPERLAPRPLSAEQRMPGTCRRSGRPQPAYRHYPASATLLRQGGDRERVFLVRSGLVKLVRHLPNGRARIVGLFRPGSVLGAPPNTAQNAANPHSALSIGPVDAEHWPAR